MIRYALKCAEGHDFESWFQSADAFDALIERGLVACVLCGSTSVSKAVMAPRLGKTAPPPEDSAPLSAPRSEAERLIAELRARIEAESEYVGRDFADEARAIHLGDAPERTIHGETTHEDARALIEDGVPVAPLPFVPGRKTN